MKQELLKIMPNSLFGSIPQPMPFGSKVEAIRKQFKVQDNLSNVVVPYGMS
jgi:hypothetical protein